MFEKLFSFLKKSPVIEQNVVPYQILKDPLPDAYYKKLSKIEQNQIDAVIDQIQEGKKVKIESLLALHQKYPDYPFLTNALAIVYNQNNEKQKSFALIKENYQKHPDYLFGRINYASACLEEGDFKEYERVMQGKSHPHELFPHRKQFDMNEVLGTYKTVALYHMYRGEKKPIEHITQILEGLDVQNDLLTLFRGFSKIAHTFSADRKPNPKKTKTTAKAKTTITEKKKTPPTKKKTPSASTAKIKVKAAPETTATKAKTDRPERKPKNNN